MLALAPIVDRLKAGGFRQVEGVLEIPAPENQSRQLPALFVVPTVETAGPNRNAGRRDQAVDAGFSVLIVMDAARRNRAGVSEDVKENGDKVVELITGWTHPEASRACDYAGGRLGSASNTTIVWEVRFRSGFHIRKDS